MLSLFQTANGAWHFSSILTVAGWLISGIIIFVGLWINRNDRLATFEKERQSIIAAMQDKAKIEDAESKAAKAQDLALQLKANQAPRTISAGQQSEMIDQLSAFKGQKFDFLDYEQSLESSRFTVSICEVLIRCGWDGSNNGIRILKAKPLDNFVFIVIRKDHPINNAASALEKILNGFGIESKISFVDTDGGVHPMTERGIRIVVGPK